MVKEAVMYTKCCVGVSSKCVRYLVVFIPVNFSLPSDGSVGVLYALTFSRQVTPSGFYRKLDNAHVQYSSHDRDCLCPLSYVIPYKKSPESKSTTDKRRYDICLQFILAILLHTFPTELCLCFVFLNLHVTKKKTSILKLLFVPQHIMLEA